MIIRMNVDDCLCYLYISLEVPGRFEEYVGPLVGQTPIGQPSRYSRRLYSTTSYQEGVMTSHPPLGSIDCTPWTIVV